MTLSNTSFVVQFQERIDRLRHDGILPRYFRAPIFVLWELTGRCNLKCIHCYYNSNRHVDGELTTPQALGLIEQMAKLRVFEVYLTGGEALMREDWPLLIETLRRAKIQVGLITNGTFIDAAAAKKLADMGVKWVQISLDGASAPVHDRVRGVAGGWQASVDAIRLLKERGIRTHVSFVPTRINFRDVNRVIALCVEMGLPYFVTDLLVLTGRAALNSGDVTLSHAEYDEFYGLLEEAAAAYAGKLTIIAPSREKETLKTYVRTRSATPNIWCIVTPQGACRLDLLLPYTFGDLKTQTLEWVWSSFLREGWERPEVAEFINSLTTMSDLVANPMIPYVARDIHCQ